MPIHRTIKNVVHNYTYAEVKVREATSNDPWGPSSSLMAEIAELTRNPLSYNETMSMIWRRMNDHGKNWRHVYKALVLLDHLIHHGAERVTRDCRNNIVAIRTLADFQHVDENGRDNGLAVREKARQLAILLGDDERLRGERIRAHENKERFGADSYGATIREEFAEPVSRRSEQTSASRRSPQFNSPPSHGANPREPSRPSPRSNTDMDAAAPTSSGEEELQLQLALAMSKEEHEEEMKRQKADDLKLQLAIEESKKTARGGSTYSEAKSKKMPAAAAASMSSQPTGASLLDAPLDQMIADPWAAPPRPAAVNSPWNNHVGNVAASQPDMWASRRSPSPVIYAEIQRDVTSNLAPWEAAEANFKSNGVTLSSGSQATNTTRKVEDYDEFAALSQDLYRNLPSTSAAAPPPMSSAASASNGAVVDLLDMAADSQLDIAKLDVPAKKTTPEEFLGPNAKLVDFDDLVSKPTTANTVNPFAMTIGKPAAAPNPFVARAMEEEQSRRVPIGQLQSTTASGGVAAAPATVWPTLAVVYSPQPVPPQPVAPQPQQGYNPFL